VRDISEVFGPVNYDTHDEDVVTRSIRQAGVRDERVRISIPVAAALVERLGVRRSAQSRKNDGWRRTVGVDQGPSGLGDVEIWKFGPRPPSLPIHT
jgi:hypothetical protein